MHSTTARLGHTGRRPGNAHQVRRRLSMGGLADLVGVQPAGIAGLTWLFGIAMKAQP